MTSRHARMVICLPIGGVVVAPRGGVLTVAGRNGAHEPLAHYHVLGVIGVTGSRR